MYFHVYALSHDLSTFQQVPLVFDYQMMEQKSWDISLPLEGSREKGFSHIYRNSTNLAGLEVTPLGGVFSLKQLLLDLFLNKYANKKFLGKIIVEATEEKGQVVEKRSVGNIISYREGYEIAVRLSSALLKRGLIFEEKEAGLKLLGIYSRNVQEFYLMDLACLLYGITCVPLYDTLGPANLLYCLQHSNISTCLCGSTNAKALLKAEGVANLQNIILYEPIEPAVEEELAKRFKVFHFWKLVEEERGEEAISHEQFKVDPEQCFTFSYTSGTTGPPKAAMLSQKNFLSFVAGHRLNMRHSTRHADDEVHLSILPMPHVYERIIVLYEIFIGSFIVPTSGNILKLKDDIATVRPTQIISVPRIFNRMIEAIFAALGGEEATRKLIDENSPVLQAIREGFGGRIKWMLSGSAPINPKVIELLGKIMGCPFVQAYGQTENTGGAFIQNLNDTEYGKLGHVWPNLQFRLQDIPQMGYTSDDRDESGNPAPRGEIWLRGSGVILGYYKARELTEEAITGEGWLRTGDVGALTFGTNTMRVIDRKKNIFKLSQGEYVSCEKVEINYVKSKYVTEAFLHGDSLQSYAVLIIVPNRLELLTLGKELGLSTPYPELCEERAVILHVLRDLLRVGHEANLCGFEQAKNLRFEPEAFAVRGIVSSTMKLQRFEARRYYKKQLEDMYAEGPLVLHS